MEVQKRNNRQMDRKAGEGGVRELNNITGVALQVRKKGGILWALQAKYRILIK